MNHIELLQLLCKELQGVTNVCDEQRVYLTNKGDHRTAGEYRVKADILHAVRLALQNAILDPAIQRSSPTPTVTPSEPRKPAPGFEFVAKCTDCPCHKYDEELDRHSCNLGASVDEGYFDIRAYQIKYWRDDLISRAYSRNCPLESIKYKEAGVTRTITPDKSTLQAPVEI